ncbi:hypothetical protein AMATHDRAFT_44765 [Amanita thiersii Skay4041]|uniref:Uncharacterized protein n=1 Tax=Amanita thiersii Skay4041 TaxID=703135 RepID=A0A2A9P159_9AGAR|nr:hypothetical protein AMATHDRAFT_44765 [Amanita thiersii Skay4041]
MNRHPAVYYDEYEDELYFCNDINSTDADSLPDDALKIYDNYSENIGGTTLSSPSPPERQKYSFNRNSSLEGASDNHTEQNFLPTERDYEVQSILQPGQDP